MELQNGLRLIKADLRRKDESLATLQASRPPPSGPAYLATPTSCKRRGCGNGENHPPEKRTFFNSLFPARTPAPKHTAAGPAPATPSARILRSRQQSPPAGL